MSTIDPQNPVAALLELKGVSASELARRMGRSTSAGSKLRHRGAAIQLNTLLEAAQALDLELELVATDPNAQAPEAEGTVDLWCGECGAEFTLAKTADRVCPNCGERDELEPQRWTGEHPNR